MTTNLCRLIPFLSLLAATALAQPAGPPAELVAAMDRLQFLEGSWTGEGWIEFAPGRKHTFRGSEEIVRKLDGTLLLIEGIHHARFPGMERDMKIHHAFALVTYDAAADAYTFLAHKSDGTSLRTQARMVEGAFEWGFVEPRSRRHMRFTIRLDESGQWREDGHWSQDGTEWTKFFEMNLRRT